MARVVADPDNFSAEFAVVVRPDLNGWGLGALLMHNLLCYCRARGSPQLLGEALPDNKRMLQFARRQGVL